MSGVRHSLLASDGAPPRDLAGLFDPRSVAIVGASSHERKWGYRLAASALQGSERRAIYLVNHNGGSILGHPVHRSLSDLPTAPELVVVVVPAAHFDAVLDEAVTVGASTIVGITAGLGEKGQDAARRERHRVARLRDAGVTLVGPNCAGLADSSSGLRLEFAPQPFGHIGLVSQSGNLIVELSRLITPLGHGFSRYVSVGNQADLVVADFIDNLAGHDATQAIACYIEDFKDGRRFVESAARAVAAGKPVAVLSVGRSPAGSRTALSHTGAMVSDQRLVRAACSAAGAELVSTPGELVDLLDACRVSARPGGRRIGVLGDGGGHCAVAADVATGHGLEVNELSMPVRARLAAMLPPTASVLNPIDIAGAAEIDLAVYANLLAELLTAPELDAILLTGYFGGYSLISHAQREREEAVARSIADLAAGAARPLVVHSIHPLSSSIAILRDAGVPVYARIESAARVLATLTRSQRKSPPLSRSPATAVTSGELSPAATLDTRVHDYFAARAVVAQAGIPQAEAREVGNLAEGGTAAVEIGYPVALKALGAAHKSDSGAVALGIEDCAGLQRAFQLVRSASPIGRFSVERMAPTTAGVEMIVGVRRDPSFGPVVVVGLGGIYAEVFDDLAVSLLPTTAAEVQRSVLALRCAPLLAGARGRPPVDVAALSRAAVALGELVAWRDDLEDVEINPLLVLPEGVLALDARVISSPRSHPGSTPMAPRTDEPVEEVEA